MSIKGNSQEAIQLFKEELLLCEAGEGQRVVVLSEGDELRDYAEGFMTAGRELGSDIIDLNLGTNAAKTANERLGQLGVSALTGNEEAMTTLKEADLVIDLMLLLFSKEQVEIQQAGTRMLLTVEPIEILKRLSPTQQLRDRVEAAEDRLARAETLRFTNEAGTDVTYELGDVHILTEYGYTVTPGRWDHWPSGFLATLAKPGCVQGKVVMKPKDIVYPWKAFIQEPVEFVIRDGEVVDIRGDGEADRVKKYMDGYNDPRSNAISHIGWGLNELCRWQVDEPGIGMDGRAHYGNVLFSLGPDVEFGGTNDTQCHLDLPMKDCTLYLDDDLIVEKGNVIPKEYR